MVFSQRSGVHPQCKPHCGSDIAQQMHNAKEPKANHAKAAIPPSSCFRSPGRAATCWALTHCISHKAPTLHLCYQRSGAWSCVLQCGRGRSAYGANFSFSSEIHEKLELNHQHWLLHHIYDLKVFKIVFFKKDPEENGEKFILFNHSIVLVCVNCVNTPAFHWQLSLWLHAGHMWNCFAIWNCNAWQLS